jgi:hypothetical protein
MGQLFKSTVFHKWALFLLLIPLVTGGIVKHTDDVNADLQSLQTLVQQQAAALSSLEAKFSALENKVDSKSKPGKMVHAFLTHLDQYIARIE